MTDIYIKFYNISWTFIQFKLMVILDEKSGDQKSWHDSSVGMIHPLNVWIKFNYIHLKDVEIFHF